MTRASVGLLLVAACGPDEAPKMIDAAALPDVVTIDAAPPARCSATTPFGAPTLVPGVNTAGDEYSFRLSADRLSAVIGRQVNATQHLFIATRTSVTAAFGTPVELAGEINNGDANRGQLHPGVLSMYLETNRDGDYNIAVAIRASATTDFGDPTDVSAVETSGEERSPYLVPNGNMYFYRAGTGIMFWASGGSANPAAVMGFTASQTPALSADELEIFVSEGTAPSVIKHATRSANTAMFGTAAMLTALNGATITEPTFVSSNACELYFSSDRAGGMGGRDIWVASRL